MSTQLKELVNTHGIRRSVKRLFSNDITECLAELFQNSQRAGATRVDITTTNNGFAYEDDGHGLAPNDTMLEGFHTLLKLAETGYSEKVVEDQDPMGLGIHSLLAHDKVGNVTFASGNLSLSLDTRRWWDDEAYYSTWFERTEPVAYPPVKGLRVQVQCDPSVVADALKCLEHPREIYPTSDPKLPARGYEGVLDIRVNGVAVRTDIPDWAKVGEVFLTTRYKGCDVAIGRGDGSPYNKYRNSNINWYGQQVPIWALPGGFRLMMTVREGRPVNLKAPARNGIIEDAASDDLKAFAKDAVFAFVLNPANRDRIQAEWVQGCFDWDEERAKRESPYLLARPCKGPKDTDGEDRPDRLGSKEAFLYGEAPLLVEPGVSLHEGEDVTVLDHGNSSFVRPKGAKPVAYEFKTGDRSRARVASIEWKPGECLDHHVHEPGEWALVYPDEPVVWKPVTDDMLPVFAFSDSTYCDIESTDIIAGDKSALDFYQGDGPWNAWYHDDDWESGTWDEQEESFRKSLDEVIRSLLGDCISHGFTLYDLKSRVTSDWHQRGEVRIESVRYHYEDEKPGSPKAITFTATLDGETVEKTLKLYGS